MDWSQSAGLLRLAWKHAPTRAAWDKLGGPTGQKAVAGDLLLGADPGTIGVVTASLRAFSVLVSGDTLTDEPPAVWVDGPPTVAELPSHTFAGVDSEAQEV